MLGGGGSSPTSPSRPWFSHTTRNTTYVGSGPLRSKHHERNKHARGNVYGRAKRKKPKSLESHVRSWNRSDPNWGKKGRKGGQMKASWIAMESKKVSARPPRSIEAKVNCQYPCTFSHWLGAPNRSLDSAQTLLQISEQRAGALGYLWSLQLEVCQVWSLLCSAPGLLWLQQHRKKKKLHSTKE